MCWFSESVVIGVVASLIASGIAWCMGVAYSKRRQRKKYAKLTGNYEGFGFKDETGRQLRDSPQSQAVISYKKDNLLSIELTHDDRTWTGLIIMETEDFGTVAWRYDDLPKDQREFGFKRCIFRGDEI